MDANFYLQLSKPCHENWQQMSSVEQGRHCTVCHKNVLDFTTFTDSQLADYLRNNRDTHLCGRFKPTQLERPISAGNPNVGWQRWAVTAALVAGSAVAQAQVDTLSVNRDKYGNPTIYRHLDEDTVSIKVSIQNTEGVMLPNIPAVVTDEHGLILGGGTTDDKGRVSIEVPIFQSCSPLVLIINENGDTGKLHLFFPEDKRKTAQITAILDLSNRATFEAVFVSEAVEKAAQPPHLISGTILDTDLIEPLTGASIYALSIKNGEVLDWQVADVDGKFTIEIPAQYTENDVKITVNMVGYDSLTQTIPTQSERKTFVMKEAEGVEMMGIVYTYRPTRWQRVKWFFRGLFSK